MRSRDDHEADTAKGIEAIARNVRERESDDDKTEREAQEHRQAWFERRYNEAHASTHRTDPTGALAAARARRQQEGIGDGSGTGHVEGDQGHQGDAVGNDGDPVNDYIRAVAKSGDVEVWPSEFGLTEDDD